MWELDLAKSTTGGYIPKTYAGALSKLELSKFEIGDGIPEINIGFQSLTKLWELTITQVF